MLNAHNVLQIAAFAVVVIIARWNRLVEREWKVGEDEAGVVSGDKQFRIYLLGDRESWEAG